MTIGHRDPPTTLSADDPLPHHSPGNRWTQPHTVFLLSALILGWAMALLTPPLQVPDEPNHFYRIWQLSQGIILAKGYEATVPLNLLALETRANRVMGQKYASIPFSHMFAGFRDSAPVGSVQKYIPNTALYAPVPYLPQIVGVFTARKLHGSALEVLYAGRFATVVGYALIGWCAIRITPVLKWAACVTLTAPMALFMAASLSADPMTTAFAYLATACCLRMILADGPVPARVVAGTGLSLIALTLCKSAYFPIAFLLAAVPPRNWGARKPWIAPVLIFAAVLVALFGWSAISMPLGVHEAGGDPAVQFHYVLQHPGKFLSNVIQTLHIQNYVLYISGVGLLGHLDTWMPVSWTNIYTAAVLWLVLTYDEPLAVPLLARAAAVAALCTCFFLIVLANYLVWTATAAPTTDGLQGRYLLPLVLLFFVIIQRPGRYRVSARWISLGIAWCMMLACWVVFSRYYVTN